MRAEKDSEKLRRIVREELGKELDKRRFEREEAYRLYKEAMDEEVSRRRNDAAKAALYIAGAGVLFAGIPYFGWAYLAFCFVTAFRGLQKTPRDLAVVALLFDLLMLCLKVMIAGET